MADRRGLAVVIVKEWRDYHVARLRGALRTTSRPLMGLEIFGQPAQPHHWIWHASDRHGVDIRTLFPGRSSADAVTWTVLRGAVFGVLDDLEPSVVVITGYSEPSMRWAALWARSRSVPAVLLSSSTRADRRRFWLKERLKGHWVARHFQAAFTSGTRSAAYLSGMGLDPTRIWRGYGVVDNDAFATGKQDYLARRRNEDGADGATTPAFLFVGRMSPEKNIGLLLDAYRRYLARNPGRAWRLRLVGSGPLKDPLTEQAAGLGLPVEWAGFRTGSDLYAEYANAGALVLPSASEPWGLVVNEAMACGLPVLVSDRCGCAPDLVLPGVNGHVFDHRDAAALADHMTRLSSGDVDLLEMGRASAEIVGAYTPDSWGKTLAQCLSVLEPTAVSEGR